MLPVVNAARREPCPASELILALQCGGSDGYSGISANPALGAAVDLLVGHGGTAILSFYGAEHLLTRRAANAKIGQRFDRTDLLVGKLYEAQRRAIEQQSVARQ